MKQNEQLTLFKIKKKTFLLNSTVEMRINFFILHLSTCQFFFDLH